MFLEAYDPGISNLQSILKTHGWILSFLKFLFETLERILDDFDENRVKLLKHTLNPLFEMF